MRKHTYIALGLILVLFVIPTAIYAAGFGSGFVGQPIGGRETQGPAELADTIVCSGVAYGPFNMQPFNAAGQGPFFIRNAAHGVPHEGGYLLGIYSVIPDMGTCTDPESGDPVQAYEITQYSASQSFGFK